MKAFPFSLIPILLILIAGAITVHTNPALLQKKGKNTLSVASSTPSLPPKVTTQATVSPSASASSQLSLKNVSPSPSVLGISTSDELKNFYYPNAQTTTESPTSLQLLSTDNPKIITDWYKAKIQESGMNTTSFVTTSTNDHVLNKLVASDGSVEVRVEIEKQSNTATTAISVTFS